MEQNNLQSDNKEAQALPPLSVGILGFEAIDKESFSRFFQAARPHQRKYVVAESGSQADSDILIVNYDNPSALKERDAIVGNNPDMPVVAVSRGPLPEPPLHHIRGMLFAARVLTTLDKVSIVSCPAATDKPQEIIRSQEPTAKTQAPKVSEISTVQVQPTITEPMVTPIAVIPVQIESGSLASTITDNAGGYCALVVDDSAAIQKSLEINLNTLTQIGRIDFADSGENALEKAEAAKYDLIFLDVMMPGIDGYETCTRLRKKPEYKKTPIIMVSGKTSPLDEVKGVMAGCTTYLTKPVQKESFQKLSIRVLAWLEKQKNP